MYLLHITYEGLSSLSSTIQELCKPNIYTNVRETKTHFVDLPYNKRSSQYFNLIWLKFSLGLRLIPFSWPCQTSKAYV